MSTLLHWLTLPEWAQLVKALLHSLWQGAFITGTLALLLRQAVNPATRYRLTLVALVVLLFASVVTWGVLNLPKVPTAPISPPLAESVVTPRAATGPVDKIVVAANWTPAKQQVQWTAWLALAWLLGASVMLGRASVKVAGAEQLRRSCQPLTDPRIAELVAEARRAVKLTRQVRVAVTNQLASPAVVGVLVPTLILPLSLITTLSPEQIRFVLLHELAHIRRGDYLANLFQLFAEALLFFNPAVWWLSHQIRREREACCDALAIELSGAPADYARTLVSVAETMLNPAPSAAPAFGNDREPSSLADRVQRVLVPGYRPSLRLTWRAMLAALVAGGVLLGLLAAGTRETVAATAGLIKLKAASTNPLAESFLSLPNPEATSNSITTNQEPALYSRTFKLGSNELARALGNLGPVSFTNSFQDVREFFARLGVDMQAPGRSIYYKDRQGIIFVRATLAELDKLEAALVARPGQTDPASSEPSKSGIHQAEGRRSIVNKLESIRLESVLMHAVPLDEVAQNLTEASRQRDPDKHGIRFDVAGIKSSLSDPANQAANARAPLLFSITVEPELKDVKLQAVLDAVVKGSSVPIQYAIMDVGVVFSLKQTNPPALYTRTFKIDTNEFVRALGMVGPVTMTNFQATVRNFFSGLGVDLKAPGKSAFYNDRRGMLFVRASLADLDIIEHALQVMNTAAPQVNIRAKFVEVPMSEGGIFLGNLGLASTNLVSQPQSVGKFSLTSNLLTGILTAAQFDVVLRALDQRGGVEILAAPEVTTLSGRQAQMQVVDIKTVVTDIASVATNGIITDVLQTNALPFGPTLDVFPFVSADGYAVQMTLIPSVTEFLGYEKPAAYLSNSAKEKFLSTDLPLPHYRLRQAVAQVNVWDGQTIVIGGFTSEIVTRQTNGSTTKVPDPKPQKKQLFVFITPTVIDPAGNRVHADEEMAGKVGAAPKSDPVFPGIPR